MGKQNKNKSKRKQNKQKKLQTDNCISLMPNALQFQKPLILGIPKYIYIYFNRKIVG